VKSMSERRLVCEIGDDVPGRILLLPWGHVSSIKGDFVVDEVAAEAVLACMRETGVDMPIDYEHQTLGGEYSSPDGTSPAAGWIKSLEIIPGEGVYGLVEWTGRARQMIAAREYRYLSPVVFVDLDTHRAMELHTVGLTNKPAIAGMQAIVNQSGFNGTEAVPESEQTMDTDAFIAAIRETVQLGEDASLEDLAEAIRKNFDAIREQAEKIKTMEVAPEEGAATIEALTEVGEVAVSELAGDGGEQVAEAAKEGDAEAVANSLRTAIQAHKRRAAGMVPAAEVNELNRRIAELESDRQGREVEALIQANSNKIAPAKREWFKKFYQNQRAEALAWVEDAPILANTAPTIGAGGGPGGSTGRQALIANIRRELEQDRAGGRAMVCSERVAIDGHLRHQGLKPLTDDEAERLQLVA